MRPGTESRVRIMTRELEEYFRFVERNREVGFESLAVSLMEGHFLAIGPTPHAKSSATPPLRRDICIPQCQKGSNVDGTGGIVHHCDDFVASKRLSRQCEPLIGGCVPRRFYMAAKTRDTRVSDNQTGFAGRFADHEQRSSCLCLGGMAISKGPFLGGVRDCIPGLKGGRESRPLCGHRVPD